VRFVGRSEVACACVYLCFVSNRQDVYRSGSGSIRKVPRSCKPHSEVNNLYLFFFQTFYAVLK
jgi:hypothetical protein